VTSATVRFRTSCVAEADSNFLSLVSKRSFKVRNLVAGGRSNFDTSLANLKVKLRRPGTSNAACERHELLAEVTNPLIRRNIFERDQL